MYVYLLQSLSSPDQKYIGSTRNLKKRLAMHNDGKSYHTAKFIPWELTNAIWFKNKAKAKEFEKYIKHGSGHAFARKHFW
ncbi:MAG: GIY-YIG nuclease family protein [Candidatus Berkiella sp.]